MISFTDGDSIGYLYGTDGAKLRVRHAVGASVWTTDYAGNMIYENGQLDKVLTENGYIDFSGSSPSYHYYLPDHLGNNRVVLSESGAVEQVNHYYPFGGLMAESSGGEVQPWKFGGKELDRSVELNQYDFSARYYDPLLSSWKVCDPLTEKNYSCSPYAYCLNNPVNSIDPDGKLVIFINGMHGGTGGKSAYWNGFDQKAMNHLKDNNSLYKDGSLGGIKAWPKNMDASVRMYSGELNGMRDAENIIKLISDENGNIKETIKIISHSMGGAYVKGYVIAILSYLQKNESSS